MTISDNSTASMLNFQIGYCAKATEGKVLVLRTYVVFKGEEGHDVCNLLPKGSGEKE